MKRSHYIELAAAALVLLMIALSVWWRFGLFLAHPNFESPDDRLLFSTESAVHYRYAKMVARGEPIPVVDRGLQAPDGIDPDRSFTLLEERVAGRIYRFLSGADLTGEPFHVFLARFLALVPALSIGVVYLAGRIVWRGAVPALIATALYTVSPMAFNRTAGNFLREDFALPLLFLFHTLFLAALAAGRADGKGGERANRPRRAALLLGAAAGAAALAALASWHLSRFFLLVFALQLPLLALVAGRLDALRDAVLPVLLFAALGGATVPVLVEKRFLLSEGMLILYASAGTLVAAARSGWSGRRTALVMFAAAAALAAGAHFAAGNADYSHVFALVLNKIRFLGQKPADPALLPYEARIFWLGPFRSPGAVYLVTQAAVLLVAGVAGGAILVRRAAGGRIGAAALSILVFLAVSLVQFLFIQRSGPLFAFYAAVAAVAPVGRFGAGGRPARAYAAPAILVAAALFSLWHVSARGDSPLDRWARQRFPESRNAAVPNLWNNRKLVEWIDYATGPNAVFASYFPTGPMILVYADRPTVLHPMFESADMRRRYRLFLEALYTDEKTLAEFCRRYQVDYLVYEANLALDRTTDGQLYVSGRRALPAASPAAAFQFDPERLRLFRLVYQDSYYRVFRFAESGDPLPVLQLPREVTWRAGRTERPGPARRPDPEQVLDTLREELDERQSHAIRAELELSRQDYAGATRYADRLLELSPDSEEGAVTRSRLYRVNRRPDLALQLIDRVLRVRPASAPLLFEKGDALLQTGDVAGATAAYRESLRAYPGNPAALARLEMIRRGPPGR